jgi:hypothetical protein
MTSPGNNSEPVAGRPAESQARRYAPPGNAAPVWYLWDGAEIRISTPRTTQKVSDIESEPRVAFCVDDQVAGEYLTLYGEVVIVADERVAELTWPLLLAYLHPGGSHRPVGPDQRGRLARGHRPAADAGDRPSAGQVSRSG